MIRARAMRDGGRRQPGRRARAGGMEVPSNGGADRLQAVSFGAAPATDSRPQVLLIEDEPSLRLLYRAEVEDLGGMVFEAGTPQEALELIHHESPDCAIVDIRLGDENGLDLLRVLLENQPTLRTVILTAYPVYRDDFSSWLADAFCQKSSDLTELHEALQSLMPPVHHTSWDRGHRLAPPFPTPTP